MTGFAEAEAAHATVSGGGEAMGEIDLAQAYNDILNELKSTGKLPDDGVTYDPYGPTSIETNLLALLQNGQPIENPAIGDKVEVILHQSPFYVEAGGQVSDTGNLTGDNWEIEVEDTRRPVGGLIVHVGEVVEGSPKVGDNVCASVNATRRVDITRNHTATHLLHAALRSHLGTHVQQRGSLVAPDPSTL